MAKLIKETTSTEIPLVDVLIIGAGPTGLFAAFQCYLCGLKSVVLDALPRPGGQCIELYPDKPIFDIPAIPVCSARKLIDNLLEQLNPVDTNIYLEQDVVSITKLSFSNGNYVNQTQPLANCLERSSESKKFNFKDAFCWLIKTKKNNTFRARYILFTTGAGKYQAQKLDVDQANLIESKYLHYAVPDSKIFFGRQIIIIGGGDSALDWAINLADHAKVTVIHRRSKFSAQPATVSEFTRLCSLGKINFQIATISQLNLDNNNKLLSITAKKMDGIVTVETDHLIVLFGLVISPNKIIIQGEKLVENKNFIVVDPTSFQTSISSIYAAGDIAWYPNKHKLILSGFHESSLATRHILFHINNQNNEKDLKLGHSSNNSHLLKAHHKI